MKLEDIKHRGTYHSMIDLKIDLEPFKDIKELREYLKVHRAKLYRKRNIEYMREYMRERYRKKHNLSEENYKKKFKKSDSHCVGINDAVAVVSSPETESLTA